VAVPFLEARDLRKEFGGIVAVGGVSFEVFPGEIRAIIGPNGAGKTTIFNLINGLFSPDRGEIRFRGRRLNGLGPSDRAALGIGRTFQNLQIFANMTVLENVMVGRHLKSGCGFAGAAFRTPRARREEREIVDAARASLAFVGLGERCHDPAASLPFGQQRLLEIARALAMEPHLLLLDEPAAGLNLAEVGRLSDLIFAIRERGFTVLLVEHNMDLVMRVSEKILVLNYGQVLAQGPPEAIRNDPAVIVAYLGAEDADA
jgi:branched-chain amino acid transport system ATP-binding protein